LHDQGRLDEAIAEYREALRIKKDYREAHNNLGVALNEKGRPDEAIAEFREALRLKKDSAAAHHNLGCALLKKGQFDEALAAFREALRLKKDFPEAHHYLGDILRGKGQLDEAIAEYREAIRLKKDYAAAHNNLGVALLQKGRPEEAMAECREALRLLDSVEAHSNLAAALLQKGRPEEAFAEYQAALRLKKDCPEAHCGLGVALRDRGRLEEAIAEFREALRLKEASPEIHYHLGLALVQQGQFRQAAEDLRRADELVSGNPHGLRAKVQAQLRWAEQLSRLDERLPAVLQGKDQPRDAAEGLNFACLCQLPCHKRYAASARFYAEAFAAGPNLAENLQAAPRYHAARAAALAGGGRGQDVAGLDEKERARLRRQALAWLRADLEAWGRQLDKDAARSRDAAAGALRGWLRHPDLAGVRGPEALAQLPADERQPWQQLWNDVDALSSRAEGGTRSEKTSGAK
jgi:tetratricopeptide (TPR) repeat protein